MRVVQVSDTHISAVHEDFAANVERVAAHINALKPDLVIHTGDVSMDGAGTARDLELSRAWLKKLPAPTLAVPGNHDVGDLVSIKPDQPVDDSRLAAWREVLGADRWRHDVPGWRLIGLNAMLFGTGHPEEQRQLEWLAPELRTDRQIAIFMHKPVCIADPAEGPRGYWTVPPEPRRQLLDLFEGRPICMIATGHLHIHREVSIGGVSHVWAPSAAFVCGESQEDLGGRRSLGVMEHEFTESGVATRYLRADGLQDLKIEPVIARIYPRPGAGAVAAR